MTLFGLGFPGREIIGVQQARQRREHERGHRQRDQGREHHDGHEAQPGAAEQFEMLHHADAGRHEQQRQMLK